MTAELAEPPVLPLEELRSVFGLNPLELRVLILAAAPGLSVDLSRLYRFAWADFGLRAPSIGFLAELAAVETGDPDEATHALHPTGRLLRSRLLILLEGGPAGPTRRADRAVTVPDAVLGRIRGHEDPPRRGWRDGVRVHRVEDATPRAQLVAGGDVIAGLEAGLRAAFRDRRGRPRLILVGASGSGRRTLLQSRAAELGYGLVEIDLEQVLASHAGDTGGAGVAATLGAAAREARWTRSVVLCRHAEALSEQANKPVVIRHIAPWLQEYEGVLAVACDRAAGDIFRWLDDGFEVRLGPLSMEQQRRQWQRALVDGGQPVAAGEALSRRLAARVDATAGRIVTAVARACRQASIARGPKADVSPADIIEAFGQTAGTGLQQLADLMETTLSWDDAVLSEETLEVLREIVSHGRHHQQVMEEWGFARKHPYGRGMSCLFSGPPGTGKTMMATVIAGELDRPLYRIDLSRIASKWVGETEKNLAKLFDEAETAQVILLFDEADSLFTGRTSVSSANDRYANMEINYLLQRMEAYDGMTILTTNLEASLDEAFKRRIRFRVHFPAPDAERRAVLWRRLLPPEAPVDPALSLTSIAARYELAGGHIKKAVLRAAYYAAEAGQVIGLGHLKRAAEAEARELGLTVRRSS